jgi:hypothetical protein
MLQFNNNHIFTGYLKQFLASFNLPTCKVYSAEFEKFFAEHGYEDPRVIESADAHAISSSEARAAVGITYLKDGAAQQYFLDRNSNTKYWKVNKTLHYNGNKILGFTKTLKNPTTLYNYQTHEYLGDYLRFLRDYENINLMSMYNCFSNRLCNNIKTSLELGKDRTVSINAYDANYKIYMLPVKLFEKYTIAIDCYQGVELFCGIYNEKLDTSNEAKDLMARTYVKNPKTLFNQPFIYDKLDIKYWDLANESASLNDPNKFLRAELANKESGLKLFIKVHATNTSSIVVLADDYLNFNDALLNGNWQYMANSTVANFETTKTDKESTLPDINSREFRPVSKLQLLALNTGVSYPFADRLVEYLVANVILPNDITSDNIKRLQKVMEDCGYSFQIDGIWEPKMQMILYDYLMNSGKFAVATERYEAGKPVYKTKKDRKGNTIYDKDGNPVYIVENQRTGNLKQVGQKMRSDFYDILGYVDKDAEKLYASWKVEVNEKTKKPQVVAKNTLENVDIYNNLYNN